MKASDVEKLLRLLGSREVVPIDGRGWIKATCPFERWKHKSGRDGTPSFGVKLSDGHFGFSCFACGQTGGQPHELLWQLEAHGADVGAAAQFLYGRRKESPPEPVIVEKKRKSFDFNDDPFHATEVGWGHQSELIAAEHEDIERPSLPESALDEFKAVHHPYLLARGFSVESIERWGLLVSDDMDRVVFPIRDDKGRLLAFSKRVTWDKPRCQSCGYQDAADAQDKTIAFGSRRRNGKGGCPNCRNGWVWPKYQHSKGFTRNLYLYGEHLLDLSLDTVVVVEGNLDPIRLDQFGVVNVVATLGSKVGTKWPTPGHPGEQAYRLSKMFKRVIILADGDEAGSMMIERLTPPLRSSGVSVVGLICPDGEDPGSLDADQVSAILGPTGVKIIGR